MEWSLEERAGALLARPSGRVDESSWQAFAERLSEAVEAAAAKDGRLIVDFSGLEYMSSRGLRAITIAKRAADTRNVRITLAAPNPIMREILAISRYDKIFPVAETVEAAL